MVELLAKLCPGDHNHLPIRGRTTLQTGRRVPRSAFAGGDMWEFANVVLQNYELAISQELDWQHEQPTFPVSTMGFAATAFPPRRRAAGG